MLTVDEIITIYRHRGRARYGGEVINQCEHACQTALLAEEAGAPDALVAASFLHDFGHLVHELGEDCAENGVNDAHERRGGRLLQPLFGDEVVQAIALHVDAKRYLCAVEHDYHASLSPASVQSLELQGGVYQDDELISFTAQPGAEWAIALRRWDDLAKVADKETPDLEYYRAVLQRCVRADPAVA